MPLIYLPCLKKKWERNIHDRCYSLVSYRNYLRNGGSEKSASPRTTKISWNVMFVLSRASRSSSLAFSRIVSIVFLEIRTFFFFDIYLIDLTITIYLYTRLVFCIMRERGRDESLPIVDKWIRNEEEVKTRGYRSVCVSVFRCFCICVCSCAFSSDAILVDIRGKTSSVQYPVTESHKSFWYAWPDE